jgi:hypothetical protein
MSKLLLLVVALIVLSGCRSPENDPNSPDYMPGYEIVYPEDLPEKCIRRDKEGDPYESVARSDYEYEHEAAWREYIGGYRFGKIQLSDPLPTVTATDRNSWRYVAQRARRDAHEQCRRMLLAEGNK